MNRFDNIEKVCAFYVSEAHLSTMIMPYISKQIEDNNIIETFFEKNIERNIETILSKIILDEKSKKEIKKINWKNKKYNNKEIKNTIKNLIINYNKIVKKINNYDNCCNNNGNNYGNNSSDENKKNIIINILINGKNEYIENINKLLDNILNEIFKDNNITIKNKIIIKIINCYLVDQSENNIKKIINESDYLLNTSGLKNINEIYEKQSFIK
jgi:hypothetical protein